jgi:hypothetical protein
VSRPAPILSAAVLFCGALGYEPTILTLVWPDGHQERLAATSAADCAAAQRAIRLGLWRPLGMADDQAPATSCTPGNLFRPGAMCIAGYNCGGAGSWR